MRAGRGKRRVRLGTVVLGHVQLGLVGQGRAKLSLPRQGHVVVFFGVPVCKHPDNHQRNKEIETYVRQTPNRTVRQENPSPRNTSSIKQVSLFVSTTPNATLLVGLVLLGSAQRKSCTYV
jgi:hypothetical protein